MKAKANRIKDKSYPEYEYIQTLNQEVLENCPIAEEFLDIEKDKDFIEEIEENYKL